MTIEAFDRVHLDGMGIDRITEDEVVAVVRESLTRGRGGRIITPNVDIMRRAAADPHARRHLDDADLIVADGMPLIWASRLGGAPLPERVAGSSLIWSLSAGLARDARSVFLLGGTPTTGPHPTPPPNSRTSPPARETRRTSAKAPLRHTSEGPDTRRTAATATLRRTPEGPDARRTPEGPGARRDPDAVDALRNADAGDLRRGPIATDAGGASEAKDALRSFEPTGKRRIAPIVEANRIAAAFDARSMAKARSTSARNRAATARAHATIAKARAAAARNRAAGTTAGDPGTAATKVWPPDARSQPADVPLRPGSGSESTPTHPAPGDTFGSLDGRPPSARDGVSAGPGRVAAVDAGRAPIDGAVRAANRLAKASPGLRIAGALSPAYGFEEDEVTYAAVCEQVIAARPDMVFVGLGFPKQEIVIERLRPHLPGTWFVGCGAAVNFVAGDIERAPRWMQRTGLEWAHRLRVEPRRLAGRYLRHDAPYALRLLAAAPRRRGTRRS